MGQGLTSEEYFKKVFFNELYASPTLIWKVLLNQNHWYQASPLIFHDVKWSVKRVPHSAIVHTCFPIFYHAY